MSSLDQKSDQNATFTLASVVKTQSHDPSWLALNKESAEHIERQNQETTAFRLKVALNVDGPIRLDVDVFDIDAPLKVYRDRKILPALTHNKNIDQLAVIR